MQTLRADSDDSRRGRFGGPGGGQLPDAARNRPGRRQRRGCGPAASRGGRDRERGARRASRSAPRGREAGRNRTGLYVGRPLFAAYRGCAGRAANSCPVRRRDSCDPEPGGAIASWFLPVDGGGLRAGSGGVPVALPAAIRGRAGRRRRCCRRGAGCRDARRTQRLGQRWGGRRKKRPETALGSAESLGGIRSRRRRGVQGVCGTGRSQDHEFAGPALQDRPGFPVRFAGGRR